MSVVDLPVTIHEYSKFLAGNADEETRKRVLDALNSDTPLARHIADVNSKTPVLGFADTVSDSVDRHVRLAQFENDPQNYDATIHPRSFNTDHASEFRELVQQAVEDEESVTHTHILRAYCIAKDVHLKVTVDNLDVMLNFAHQLRRYNENQKALAYYRKCESLVRQTATRPSDITPLLMATGCILEEQGSVEQAQIYFEEAMKYFDSHNLTNDATTFGEFVLNNIKRIDLDKEFSKCLQLFELKQHHTPTSVTFSHPSPIHTNQASESSVQAIAELAEDHLRSKNYDSALKLWHECFNVSLSTPCCLIAHVGLARTYHASQRHEKAYFHIRQARELFAAESTRLLCRRASVSYDKNVALLAMLLCQRDNFLDALKLMIRANPPDENDKWAILVFYTAAWCHIVSPYPEKRKDAIDLLGSAKRVAYYTCRGQLLNEIMSIITQIVDYITDDNARSIQFEYVSVRLFQLLDRGQQSPSSVQL